MTTPTFTNYFAAQDAIRRDTEQKIARVQQKYEAMPFTADVLEAMARRNQMFSEIIALNDECETKLAALPKPTGVSDNA